MRIALVNIDDDNNRGSSALTWAALDLLDRAFPGGNVTIVPMVMEPGGADPFRHTKRRYPHVRIVTPPFEGRGRSEVGKTAHLTQRLAAVYLHRAPRLPSDEWMGAIREADLVVVCGGVSLHTCVGSARGDLAFLGRLLPLLAAQASRKPTVLLGAQVGPFRSLFGRFLLRRALRTAIAVVARDAVSRSEVQNVVPANQVLLTPDSIFGLALDRVDMHPVFARHGLDPARPTLALVISTELRSDESEQSHIALLASAGRTLLETTLISQIVIVIQADRDRGAGRHLATLLGLGPDSIVDDDLDPAQLISLYAACRLVVSSRLHGVLLSLLAGTPALSVAPEFTFKEGAVLDVMGLADLCVPTRDGSARLSEACTRLVTDSVTYSQRIDVAVRGAQRTLQTTVPVFLRDAFLAQRA